jgi:type I restriction enzyme S subunit
MVLCDRLEAARASREAVRDRLAAASLARLNTPDPETFRDDALFALDALPALTARPDQIRQMRQTILDLAVRGKLVPQDPNDEPAAELLKRIAEQKAIFANGRGRSKVASISALSDDDTRFAPPPSGWVWSAFGDIVISRDGERIPVSQEERNGRAKLFDYYGASGVIDKIDNYLFDRPLLLIGEDGANLINRSTPIAFIARGKYWVNNHAHVLDGISEGFLRYLELFINAIDLKPYVTGTAQPKMNQAKMNSIAVALPPLAEQHRIVAKVDELMALCNRLEASLTTANNARRCLLDALLAEALVPAEERELEAAE